MVLTIQVRERYIARMILLMLSEQKDNQEGWPPDGIADNEYHKNKSNKL